MAVSLRDLERASIREFVGAHADKLTGRVLDFGCGLQPYRDVVEAAGGEYVGYDRVEFRGSVVEADVGEEDPFYLPKQRQWDAVLCTQVLQYDRHPGGLLSTMYEDALKRGGHLVLTYPTTWPEVEPDDLHRFTKAGMQLLLDEAGFKTVVHERRECIWSCGEVFALGYGAVARA